MINTPYNYNNAVGGSSGAGPVQDQAFPSTSLLGAFLSRLPYAYQIIDSMVQRNDKFNTFKNVAPKREEFIQDDSVFLHNREFSDALANQAAPGTPGDLLVNKDYQAFVYANVDKDKNRRLTDYRRMAAYAELAECIDEICDECIVKDENDDITVFNLRGEYSKEVKDLIEKEYKTFINIYNLEDDGWEYFRQFLTDGELFFENIVHEKRKDLGIIGLVSIPAELINPVYQNVQNEMVKGFLIRKPIVGPTNTMNQKDQEELFFMQKAQVTYVHSGMWNEFKTIRLPYIENAKRAYRQLSLIEDSVVIYRMVRAPERLKFTVYTGNMPAPKAEAFLKRLMQTYWTRKNYDGQQGGRVTNTYNPQSMLDAYWFTKDAQGNGTDVSVLPSGGNLGEIKDLNYFLKKLYNSLKIPVSRFIGESSPVFSDGQQITRDELRFARFVIRIQRQFATSIRETFIAHLKLKGYWKQYKIKEKSIHIEFNVPTSFMAIRDQQLLEMKFNNFSTALNTQAISPSYAMKYYLGLSDELMKENREWQKNDAAFRWELGQIEAAGPNFREQLAAQGGAASETPGAPAGGGGGGGGGGSSAIPPFGGGEAPTGGGEAPTGGAEGTPNVPPAGGAPAAPAPEAAPTPAA